VFITERAFENTDMEGITSIDLRNVLGFLTNRSVKWRLNPLGHQCRMCGSHSSAGVPTIVLNKKSKLMNDKKYKENTNISCFLIRSFAVKII